MAGMSYDGEEATTANSWQAGEQYEPHAVRFYDIAQEGAQLRCLAEHVSEGVLAFLEDLNPRSVVVVAADQISKQAAQVAVSLFEPLSLPIVFSSPVPNYVGPLDVVVAVTEKRVDDALSEQLAKAGGRGAAVVIATGGEGPLVEDTPDDAAVIPALPLAEGISPARAFAVVFAVMETLRQGQSAAAQTLHTLAEQVDAELMNVSPEREESVNPAAQLAHAAAGHSVIHSGMGRTGQAIGALMAPLWSSFGYECVFLEHETMLAAWPRLEQRRSTRVHDIFYDPFLDGPLDDTAGGASTTQDASLPLRRFVWADPGSGNPVSVESSPVDELDAAGALRLMTRGYAATVFFDKP